MQISKQNDKQTNKILRSLASYKRDICYTIVEPRGMGRGGGDCDLGQPNALA